ncbi:aldose epimerase family protein [uncultured Vibrio sp.]|uniref:aldose epimerase family protein n=1 Tax=uncultured Vibrio sp. TaxID=114054 RepID=UPI0025EEEA88|nr:aldose epimerase family protein [uncultured Vibrio sp.]
MDTMINADISQPWGNYSLYTLTNENGVNLEVSNLGATIVKFWVTDNRHCKCNIVLGFETPEEYLNSGSYIGGIVGPWGNRVEGGAFEYDGETFQLECNEGNNHLHGASCELHKRRWSVAAISPQGITLQTTVKKGEAGYPANLRITVTYRLSDENELTIRYGVESDSTCPVNPTQHTYFNLSGQRKNIREHVVAIDANKYWKTDFNMIPKEKQSVANTVMDFLIPKKIDVGLSSFTDDISVANGYDHCYILNGQGLRTVGWVYEPSNGIALEILTDRPGLQFYTGNHLGGEKNSKGESFMQYAGFCLETQAFPNQVNMNDLASEVMASPESPFFSTTIFKIQVEKAL